MEGGEKLNKCPQAACIDGVNGNQDISELFANKCKTVYNSVGYEKDTLENLKATVEELIRNSNVEYQYVSVNEVAKAIAKLKLNKHDGNLGLFSNHFNHSPKNLQVHLSMLFSGILTHGYTPMELGIATLTSIPKDIKQ